MDETQILTPTRAALDALTNLCDDAFGGNHLYSLMANLRDLREEDWDALPQGGGRSIASVLEHVGRAIWLYEDSVFGPGVLRGDCPPMIPEDGAISRPRAELLAWMREGHRRWIASLRALPDDSELDRPRRAMWGAMLPTREFVHIVTAHSLYHAGEINHIRALLQGNDRWE